MESAGARTSVGTPGSITFAALNRKHTDIYTINADGTTRRQLTRGIDDEYCPAWSPDGKALAVLDRQVATTPLNGGSWIEVVSPTGLRRWRAVGEGCPSWSPDGSHIAFFSATRSGLDLYVVGANGLGRRRLAANVDHRLANGVPAWSPDGRELAYMSEGDSGRFVIRITSSDGTHKRLLKVARTATFCSDYCQLYAAWMTWAPAKDIAFLIAGGDLFPEVLYAIGADGRGQRLLSGELEDIYVPVWSPDATRIAFVSRDGSVDQFWTASAEGTDVRQLTHVVSETSNLSGVFDPSWSPDGTHLAGWGHAGGLYVVDSSSGAGRLLTRDRGGDRPSWHS